MSDIYRHTFGYFNPNHAAAIICAQLPLCWGWRRCAWLGWIAFAALCVMLAMTQSRTGLVLMAIEIAVLKLKMENVKWRIAEWFVLFATVAVIVWWAWPRLTIDDSILRRVGTGIM